MAQNRKKLIQLLIGNLANAIVHEILELSINKEDLASKYRKELIASFEIAKKYREKINPIKQSLNEKDIDFIKDKIAQKVKAELLLRVSRGYEGINLELIEPLLDKKLKTPECRG